MKVTIGTPAGHEGTALRGGDDGRGPDDRLVTVPRLLSALRRSSRALVAAAVAGAAAAALLSVAFPPGHSATTLLLLRHPDPGRADPARAMETDVELAESKSVARRAVVEAGLDVSARDLVADYQATALTDTLLQVTVKGPSPREAVRRATAVAEAFLGFRRQLLERQAGVTVASLEERRATLDAELTALNAKISSTLAATGAPPPLNDASDLLSRRAGLHAEQAELRRRIDEVVVGSKLVVDDSRVVDAASNDERSPLTALGANVAAGVVAGLALAGALVVLAEVGSDRVTRGEEAMASLGVPVAVSVADLGHRFPPERWWLPRPLRDGPRLRRRPPMTRRDVVSLVGHLRASLSRGNDGSALAVVSVDSDGPAALAVACTATELADEGRKVLVVDLSRRSALAHLFRVDPNGSRVVGVAAAPSKVAVAFLRPELHEGPEEGWSDRDLGDLRRQADVVLALTTDDAAVSGAAVAEWASTGVVVVTAGRSTPARLRSVSLMARAAGLRLRSAVLIGAGPTDEGIAESGASPRGLAVESPAAAR